MSVCQVFTEFRFIFVMHFRKKFTETETTENVSLCYKRKNFFDRKNVSLCYKSTEFCCYYECIQIKVDPLQIRMIAFMIKNYREFYVLFGVIRKKNATKCTGALMCSLI